MAQIITWLLSGGALIVAICSLVRSYKVSEAQLSLPGLLRDQALRDALRDDLSEARLDLETFAREWARGDRSAIPSSVLALERSAESRAQPLGADLMDDVKLCSILITGVSIQVQIEDSEHASYVHARNELVDAREHNDRTPEDLQALVDAADDAKAALRARQARIVAASEAAQVEIRKIVRKFITSAEARFPGSTH